MIHPKVIEGESNPQPRSGGQNRDPRGPIHDEGARGRGLKFDKRATRTLTVKFQYTRMYVQSWRQFGGKAREIFDVSN
jgi:hypothetical protein